MKKYDVIVVGAGPAGSMAAYTLSKEGMKVLLIDRKDTPGRPKQCAEAIGKKTFEFLKMKVEDKWISNKYDSLLLGIGNKSKVLFKTPRTKGYVLDRKVFDYDLAMKAHSAGAEIIFGTAVEGVKIQDEVTIETTKGKRKAKVLIAADGPQSKIAKQLGLGQLKNNFSFQYELEGTHELSHTLQMLFYPGADSDSCAWIFPKKKSVNVGIASEFLPNLKKKLNQFVQTMDLSSRKILELNAGLIPGQNKLKKIFFDRVLIVGDAAGHTNPFTGGGIPTALYDGVLSAEVTIKAIKADRVDARYLCKYQQQWEKSPFGKAWREGGKLRKEADRYKNSKVLTRICSKVDFETITSRKGAIKKGISKGFTPKESIMLYKFMTLLFDKVIDYAM